MAEKDLYQPIKDYLEKKYRLCGYTDCYIEITAEKKISNRIYNKFKHPFSVLNHKFFPDLIALYKDKNSEKSTAIEVKEKALTIKDIFQALSYGKILKSNAAFLISPVPLDEKITSFLTDREDILKFNRGKQLYIGRIFQNDILDGSWFPGNPF